jgi:uncharacterized HAD superfamily protein
MHQSRIRLELVGMRMNLGFDIDGVISDFVGTLLEVVRKRYGLVLAETDIYCHDLDQVFGVTKQERDSLVRETLLNDPTPNTGAKETLTKLSQEQHQVLLLTARPADLADMTRKWLERREIPYSHLVQLNEGEKHLANVSVDLVVEDNLEDAIGWSSKIKHVLVYDHPWNKSFNVNGLFKRIYSWADILEEIELLKVA